LADAAPSQPVRRAITPSRERAVDPRTGQQNRAREDRDAAAQKAEDSQDFDSDDRDINDDDRYRGERHYIPDIIDATPRYDPEYAAAAPPRARNDDRRDARNDSNSSDRSNDAGDYRDDGDDRLAANDARGEDRDDYDGPDRSDANRASAFPPHTRLIRGPDGRWYLLHPRR
jgi:hypothetical protein